MFGHLAKAVGQLTDPRLRGVLWLGIGGALAIFVALWAVLWWLLVSVDPSSVWGLSWIVSWMGEAFGWVAGVAFAAGMLMASFLMFPAAVTVIFGLLLDRVAAAVEARHYPAMAAGRAQPLAEVLASTLKFALTAILLNLLALPFYLVLMFVPPLGLVLYYLLNGYLIGREYFELVAFRHLPPAEATRLRRRYRARVLTAGAIVALAMTIPVVNLVAPILGAAFMVHVAHELMARRPR